jgi:16S rRNA (uracil1498-N3)-methyltransferase
MRLTRCFVPTALQSQSTLRLPAAAAAHVAKVLRLRPGAALTLFDGRGGEFEAQVLALDRHGVHVRVGPHRAIERESPIPVTLLQCLVRAERMDWIVQKATELGAAAIVALASQHSVVRLDDSSAGRRLSHWQAVALSACEQCGRNRVPPVRAVLAFERACAEAHESAARLMLVPEAQLSLASAAHALAAAGPVTAVSLLVGPEGGFSEQERATAHERGFVGCHLGPRILRAETAALAALAAIQALLVDLLDQR